MSQWRSRRIPVWMRERERGRERECVCVCVRGMERFREKHKKRQDE